MKSNSVIREILYGNYTVEKIEMGEEYFKLLDAVVDVDREMEKQLERNPKLLELYKQFKDISDNMAIEEATRYFEEGVRFGAMLGIEVASK